MARAGYIPRGLLDLALAVPGMRNILVHGYAEVDHEIVYDVLTGELEGLARLLHALWLAAESLDP